MDHLNLEALVAIISILGLVITNLDHIRTSLSKLIQKTRKPIFQISFNDFRVWSRNPFSSVCYDLRSAMHLSKTEATLLVTDSNRKSKFVDFYLYCTPNGKERRAGPMSEQFSGKVMEVHSDIFFKVILKLFHDRNFIMGSLDSKTKRSKSNGME